MFSKGVVYVSSFFYFHVPIKAPEEKKETPAPKDIFDYYILNYAGFKKDERKQVLKHFFMDFERISDEQRDKILLFLFQRYKHFSNHHRRKIQKFLVKNVYFVENFMFNHYQDAFTKAEQTKIADHFLANYKNYEPETQALLSHRFYKQWNASLKTDDQNVLKIFNPPKGP